MTGERDRSDSFAIAGSGVYLPQRVVTARELDALTNRPEGSTAASFHLRERRWASPAETSSQMGAWAAEAALAEAGWDRASLDVILGACGVMEQPIPGTSVLIQRRLGLGDSGIPAFDINATCLSFLLALDHVLTGFSIGRWRRALIVSADIASAALDFSDPEASVLFGDGAAAFALEANGPHVRLAHRFNTFGEAADVCRLEAGGTRLRPDEDLDAFMAHSKFHMEGRGVFRATSRRFGGFLAGLLSTAGISPADLDVVIPHQASAAALEHLKRAIPSGDEKVVDIFADIGNQIATSLPFAWHVARQRGLLHPGRHGLMIGTSAGVSLGGAVIRW